jgi:Domain of unknown function (DUF4124)
MFRFVAITSLIVAGICGVARADVYRWVDDHGEPHYSDRWVPGSELIKSNKPHPATPNSDAALQGKTATATQRTSADAAQQASAQAVKQDVAKARNAQCKQAKDRYQQSIQARRMYKPSKDKDGEREYMSDAEIDAYRLQARNDVKDACGSVPEPQY